MKRHPIACEISGPTAIWQRKDQRELLTCRLGFHVRHHSPRTTGQSSAVCVRMAFGERPHGPTVARPIDRSPPTPALASRTAVAATVVPESGRHFRFHFDGMTKDQIRSSVLKRRPSSHRIPRRVGQPMGARVDTVAAALPNLSRVLLRRGPDG